MHDTEKKPGATTSAGTGDGNSTDVDNVKAGAGPYGGARNNDTTDGDGPPGDENAPGAIGSMSRDQGVDQSGADKTAGGEYTQDQADQTARGDNVKPR